MSIIQRLGGMGRRSRNSQQRLAKAVVEALESRVMLSTYTVTSTADTGASGTLRWAINSANTSGTNATIDFSLSGTGPWSIDLSSTLPEVNDSGHSITINGPGASSLSINGGGFGSVFTVADHTIATIENLTISGGSTTGNGGGIDNLGTLTVTNCIISGNTAANGGGIYSQGAAFHSGEAVNLTVKDCTLSGNSAVQSENEDDYYFNGYGGGISVSGGNVYIYDGTEFTDNNAGQSGGGLSTGDVNKVGFTFVGTPKANVEVSNVTFTDNSVSSTHYFAGGGAGIYNDRSTLTVTSSVLTGNTTVVTGGGGAIFSSSNLNDSYGSLYIDDSTLTNNSAQYGGAVYSATPNAKISGCTITGNSGGGVNSEDSISLYSSTISGNTGTGILVNDSCTIKYC